MVSPDAVPEGMLKSKIATAIVQLLHEYTGRGPTRARTYIEGDLVTVLLRDTMTAAEKKLCDRGDERFVLELRHRFQLAMEDDSRVIIEDLTGRKVQAFMSTNHIEPDVAAEVFLLEPLPDEV